jgi:hypothetical protein
MQHKRLTVRLLLGITMLTSSVGLLVAGPSPALAAGAVSPGIGGNGAPPPGPLLPGVVAQPDGWLVYTDTMVSKLALVGSTTTTLSGTKTAGGACDIHSSAQGVPTTAHASYQEEIAFNPKTCQERVVSGALTPNDQVKLAAANPNSLASDVGSLRKPPAVKVPTASKSSSALAPLVTAYGYANVKTSWIDPLNITITSLADNLSWPLYGAGGYLNGRGNPYDFPYDGWSSSGVAFGPGDIAGAYNTLPGDAGWSLRATDHFTNTDFASFVYVVFGPAGWAACGFPFTATAHFNHDVTVYGYRSGARDRSWNDTANGACVDLVHHRESDSDGWTS